MSYTKKLTTFTKGNQLSNCGKYNLEDLNDMFSETEIGGAEDEDENETYLEDILIESKSFNAKFDLNMSVTIMEQLNDDSMDMYIIKSEDEHCDCGNELEGKDVICESCEDEITDEYIITKVDHNDDIVVPCSAELDNQMYNESI